MLTVRCFDAVAVMTGSTCVVQCCNNKSDHRAGISLHRSPASGPVREKWIRFVRTHSANFNPSGIFVVCSNHFTDECFQRALHIEGFKRTIIPLSVPTIWKKEPEKTFSARKRRQVGDLIKLGFFVILAGLRELWLKVSLLY